MLRFVFLYLTLMVTAVPAMAQSMAVVDFMSAAERTSEGKKANTKLEALYASRQSELDRLKTELEKEVAEYQTQAMIMSESARAEREQALGMKQAQLQQAAMQAEAELGQMQMELTTDLGEKMRAVAQAIAKEKGYDLVIDKAVAVFAGPAVPDITDALVTKYNAAHP